MRRGFLALTLTTAARFRRQDGTGTTVQDAPGVASTSTATLEDVVSSSGPATIALVATSLGDSTGSAPSGGGGSPPGTGPQGFTSNGLGVTVQAEAVLATSTGAEFVDPGAFGAGGTLTSDTRAPSRSADPTKITVDPISETTKGPPPAETTKTSSVRVPPTRPGRPAAPDAGQTTSYNLAQPASTTTAVQVEATTAAQATTTAPRGGPPGGGPPKPTSVQIIQDTTESVNLGYGVTSSAELGAGQTTFATSTRSGNETFTYIPSGGVSYCKPSDLTAAVTSWSITHTSTITWFGNPEDYTPPYPPIVIPQPTQSCVIPVSPPRLTISICASTGTGTKYMTCEVTTTTESFNFGVQTTTVPAIVFLTTDKNPAVVYSTIKTPNYGVSQEPKTRDNHASPTSDGVISTPVYNSQGGPQAISETAQQRPTPTPVTVAVQPTAVVINGNTIRDNPAQQTQVVIIADQTFTIDPTRVVGGGATIDRPAATGGVFVPTPTSTVLGGVPVVVSSSVAVIGGSSFTLGPTTTIATVSGHTFTIGPSTIAGASQTLPLPTLPSPTEVVVAGGDLITAIGRSVVVIHGTTLTYATATDGSNSPTTITVDDDVLTLGPGGVTFTAQGGTAAVTIGGTASPQQGTQYALVGGATITKIGASVVVVKSVTYTVGPGTGTTTTAVGGETVTIRPDGVQVGTLSLGFPFGPTTVITPGAGVGGAGAKATSTASGGGGNGSGGDGEEDAAGAVRPWLVGVGWGLAIALMVGGVV